MITLAHYKIRQALAEKGLDFDYLYNTKIAPVIIEDLRAGKNVDSMDFTPAAEIALLLDVGLDKILTSLG